MNLLSYLCEHFPVFDFETIKKHFLSEFGVDVKKYENKYLFKYDTILADFSKEVTHECRGTIIYYDKGNYRYYSRPFDKFFNLHEGKHSWNNDKYLESNAHNIRLVEKKDGSCIQVYYDYENEQYRASTLGSIQTESVFDEPYTFSDLFWKIFDGAFELHRPCTYLFELWTKSNQVVTNYDEDHLTLLSVRNVDGRYSNRDLLEKTVHGTKIRLPIFIDRVFKNISEINEFVENQSNLEHIYGEVPEGFVAYDIQSHKPAFKVKNLRYVQYHRINTGDCRYVTKNMASALFEGNIDDMYSQLSDSNKEYVDRLRKVILEEQVIINEYSEKLSKCTSKKEMALMMRDSIPKTIENYSGMFFMNYDNIVLGENPSLVEWMRQDKRYNKYMDKWKIV